MKNNVQRIELPQGSKPYAPVQDPAGSRFDAILDAAETEFGTSSFNGASMRNIAERAGVAQATIHYHFNTKEQLFDAVVARRSGEINQLREDRLAKLLAASQKPALTDVIDVLLRPTLEVGHRIAGGSNSFARILVVTASSADPRSVDLTKRYYDPIARQFIAAFEKSTPSLGHKNAVWTYLFAIGVGITMMAQTGRPQRLSNGLCDDSNVEAMLARIIPFVTAGIEAVVGVGDNEKK